MSAWSLVGLLIAVRVGAAAARSTTMARRVDAVDEVPNFMKNARPAQTRRRLDACLGQTARPISASLLMVLFQFASLFLLVNMLIALITFTFTSIYEAQEVNFSLLLVQSRLLSL